MHKKNIVLTFALACFPGFGQMYQGYMKRGVALLFWFCTTIAATGLTQLELLVVAPIVIWAYAFFDTFNIRNLNDEQRRVFYDDYIPNSVWLRENKLDRLQGARGSKLLAYALIAIGAVTLYNNFFKWPLREFTRYIPIVGDIFSNLPTLLVAAAVILVGLWMLRRNQPSHKNNLYEDDLVQYKGEDQDGQ